MGTYQETLGMHSLHLGSDDGPVRVPPVPMAVKLSKIPMPPSMNNSYPTNRYGVRFKSVDLKKWEAEFRSWCMIHHSDILCARRAFSTPKRNQIVVIDTEFWFPRTQIITKEGWPKKNDTTNRLKHIHDAVAQAIFLDDKFFFDGSFQKRVIDQTGVIHGHVDIDLYWIQASWMEAP